MDGKYRLIHESGVKFQGRVALSGVLVAVSIPIFTSQLEKAREATDLANIRAAKAALVTKVLDGDSANSDKIFAYDAAKGELVDKTATVTGYGKGTASGDYNTNCAGQVFYVTYVSSSQSANGTWAASAPESITTSIEAAYTPKPTN